MARIDHTNCTHPRTPAGRSACRRMSVQRDLGINMEGLADSGANRGVIKEEPRVHTPMEREIYRSQLTRKAITEAARNARMNRNRADAADGRMARRRAPSADGVDYNHCVQAALHVGRGRCACGWHTEGF